MTYRRWTGVTEHGNTTPDWWLWNYFGTTALTDTNVDNTGSRTLVYDYLNGFNPNPIVFTVNSGNAYFNTTTATASYHVVSGGAVYESVLVNDTNTNHAVWQLYDGLIHLNFGAADGAYQVLLGMKGFAPSSLPTWIYWTFYLDRVAPTVVLTSPTNSAVSQPMIQIQGYANEPLSQLTFAVSNSLGTLTNQNGYVTSQYFNTNLGAFTTNYFQCYDVPLVVGTNSITIYATDLAGNTTLLTTNYILSYSNNRTAPALTVLWPQSGTSVCSSNFTLQASVDDDTATVTATMIDAYGNTNRSTAMVERSGLVWAKNLPLSGGTNSLQLTATSAAGMTSVTNLTVIQNAIAITMIPLTQAQLNQSSVTAFQNGWPRTTGNEAFKWHHSDFDYVAYP